MTTPTAAAAAPAGKAQAAAPPPQAFRIGVYDREQNDYDATVTMTAAQVNFPGYVLSPNGWLRGLWFLFELVTAANAATTVFNADAPFNMIAKITFKDVGGREIFGPLTGFDWATIQAFGGYQDTGDPRSDLSFSAVAGVGAGLGGSATVSMYLPLEIVQRDQLGDLENKSSSTTYRCDIVLAASTDVYATPPTTLGTCRLRIIQDGYSEPLAADGMGRPLSQAPPAVGVIQYWGSENQAMNAGNATYNVQQGLGYSIRTLIFKLLDTANTRAQGDADWPDPVTISFGDVQLNQRYKKQWISRMGRDYGLTNTVADSGIGALVATSPATLSRFNGVYPVWFTKDFALTPGDELRNAYLVTKPGNLLRWKGTIGGAGTHTLFTAVNYIVSPNGDPAALRASR